MKDEKLKKAGTQAAKEKKDQEKEYLDELATQRAERVGLPLAVLWHQLLVDSRYGSQV